MKSKSKISKQVKRKNNPELVQTIAETKKHPGWMKVAEILSGPRKNRINLNLHEIDKQSKDSEKVLVIGKVLSNGEAHKKIKVVALSFSKKAKERLLKQGCGVLSIIEEVKQNPSAQGIKVLK